VKTLGKKEAQAAHRLLTSCATSLFNYIATTTPPHLTVPVLQKFDSLMEETYLSILSCEDMICSDERRSRAMLRLSLPAPVGGGLLKAVDKASVAWWSSVAAALSDPLFFKLRHGLDSFTQPAFDFLQFVLGGTSCCYWTHVSAHFPPTSAGLLHGDLYNPDNPLSLKLNQLVLKSLKKRKAYILRTLLDPDRIDDLTLTAADVVDGAARSGAGRIFAEPLKRTFNLNFPNDDYIAYHRLFLTLPPRTTIGNATVQASYDYPVQACLSNHDIHTAPFLDANGAHAGSNCKSTFSARQRKHNNIVKALSTAAKQAGLEVKGEPDTYALLLGEFSRAECRRIFPKDASPAYKQRFADLLVAIEQVDADTTTPLEQKQAYLKSIVDSLPHLAGDLTGLRVDLSLEDPVTGELKLVDVTVAHTTSASYLLRELNAVKKRQTSTTFAQELHLPDACISEPCPTLATKEKQKTEKYSRLLLVTKKQYSQRKRKQAPSFSPFAIADNGELGQSAMALQEWLVDKYRKQLVAETTPRLDGSTPQQLIRSFRHNLKLSVQFALAAGVGAVLNSTGLAWHQY